MVAHGIASLFYFRRAKTREEESILRGIAITFIPQLVTFPLDMIFLSGHSFKLAYISVSILVVYLYFFISRHYFQTYEPEQDEVEVTDEFFRDHDLSAREQELARLLIDGHTNFDIGEKLFISVNTVKSHIKSIYKKLEVKNRIQLMHMVRTGSDRSIANHGNGRVIHAGMISARKRFP
jgi:DNA-binding CsgD family transcriptional regulator